MAYVGELVVVGFVFEVEFADLFLDKILVYIFIDGFFILFFLGHDLNLLLNFLL